jgi:hypothetical protein
MEVINRGPVSLDEIDAPEILYKYRHFDDPKHLRILSEREIYFAAPTSFEDTLDCKIPVRFDLLTEREIYEKYLFESKNLHPNWTRQNHRKWARDWTKRSPLKDKQGLREMTEHYFQEYNKRIGILSLTANNKSKEMWTKYSKNLSGFCVGFDTKTLFGYLGGGGPVNYDFDELPIIWPTPKHSYDVQRQLQVFSKLRKWNFEEEYRTLIFSKNELNEAYRKRTIPTTVYKEIILGQNITKENEMEFCPAPTPCLCQLRVTL